MDTTEITKKNYGNRYGYLTASPKSEGICDSGGKDQAVGRSLNLWLKATFHPYSGTLYPSAAPLLNKSCGISNRGYNI